MSVCMVSSMPMPVWWVEEMPCSAWKSLRWWWCLVCAHRLPWSSPLPWEQLKRFASAKLWILVGFFLSLPLAAEERWQLEGGR